MQKVLFKIVDNRIRFFPIMNLGKRILRKDDGPKALKGGYRIVGKGSYLKYASQRRVFVDIFDKPLTKFPKRVDFYNI